MDEKWWTKEYRRAHPITYKLYDLVMESFDKREPEKTDEILAVIEKLEEGYRPIVEKYGTDWVVCEVFPGAKSYFSKGKSFTGEHFYHYIEDFFWIEDAIARGKPLRIDFVPG